MPTAIMKITGLNLDEDLYQSEHKIDDPKLLQIIQTSLKQGKKKTKKKADENAVADRNGPAS